MRPPGGLRAIPRAMTAAYVNPKIDAAKRERAIDGAIASLNEFKGCPTTS